MAKAKQTNKSESTSPKTKDARAKYFLQMLDIKSDTNMTRVYSILKNSSFINNI
jgi:hypothetical protein